MKFGYERERVKKRDRAVMVLGLIFVWLCESLDFEHTRQHKKWSERVEKNEKQIPYLNFVNQIVILFFSRVILIVDLLTILFMEIYFLLKYFAFVYCFSPPVESGSRSVLASSGFSPLPIAVAGIEP
jgi:hypothetical protein